MKTVRIIKGIGYGRVSTFDQAYHLDGALKTDASPQMQRERCNQYIKNLSMRGTDKYEIIEHISDDGFSGKNTKRPGYQKLVEYIKNRKISFIVSTELSRISRNTFEFLELLSLCEKNNVAVIIIDLNLDTVSPIGKAITTILVSLAQFEREITVQRVKENGKARLLRDGKINGTTEVLGLDADKLRKGHFIINEAEAERLKEIYLIYLNSLSRADAFRTIKKNGIKNKNGKEFTKHTFSSLFVLAKSRYRGVWPLTTKNANAEHIEHIKTVSLSHGPVVDIELLDKVLLKLNADNSKRSKCGENYTYLLTGLLQYEDGTKFYGHSAKNKQYRYYHNKKNDIRIRCDELDKLILARLHEYLSDDLVFMDILALVYTKQKENIIYLRAEISRLEKRLLQLKKEENLLREKLLCVKNSSNDDSINNWIEENIIKVHEEIKSIMNELKVSKASIDEVKNPIHSDCLRSMLKTFQKKLRKQSNVVIKSYLNKFCEKVLVKSNNTIELRIYMIKKDQFESL